VFEGLVALRDPVKSWVARWQRVEQCEKGVYAVKVSGNVRPHLASKCIERVLTHLQLPEEILRELENLNIVYRPRDGSYVIED
jgi:transcription elongation factor SPT4